MTDGHPGWFKDPSDGTLARWHDGNDWTEHTLVIADQTPGEEPPPPVITPPTESVPVTAAAPSYAPRHTQDDQAGDDGDGRFPGWLKIALPIVVVLVGVLGFSMLSGSDDDPPPEEVATGPASLDEAVDAARDAGLPAAVSDSRAARLIDDICDAAQRPTDVPELGSDLGLLPVTSASELRTSVAALGEGAEERCPEDMDDAPNLVDDLQDQAFLAFSTTTTTAPTIPGEGEGEDGEVDGDTDGGTGGGGTATTRRRSTNTTQGSSASTTTTAAPTTTTKNDIQTGFPCSTEGATAIDKFGKSVTCSKPCGAGSKLTWRSSPCPTAPTIPTTVATTTTTAQQTPPSIDPPF